MRRIFWTLGMTMIGLFLALKGQDVKVNIKEILIAGIWAGCIGYGLGSIFSQHRPGMRLIIYWAVTLALVGLFFGPLLPIKSFIVGVVCGGAIGALIGVLVGTLQLKLAQRKSPAPSAGVAS